jgi:hypothetical protein
MMDPLLAQGFSNLTKALIGDPETDYQVARTGYQDAQTNRLNKLLPHEEASLIAQAAQRNAAAGASTKQGGYFESQTVGQNLKNDQLSSFAEAMKLLSTSPEAQAAVAAATGIDLSNPEINSALVRSMFGSGGNASQTSAALTGLGDSVRDAGAYAQIMDPNSTPEAVRNAFIAMGNSPTKYFGADAASTEIANDLKAALDKNYQNRLGTQYTADRNLEGTQATADATEAYQNYRSDLQYGVGGSADREGQRKTTQAKWEHNNATLEINVEPGKQVVLSPAAGERLGLEPNDEGLYVLDGGPKPGSIVVKVGEEDVYLTEADATALGIEKNDAGTYMIPGRANPTNPDGSSKPNYSVPPNVDSSFQEQLDVLMDGKKLPLALQLQIKAMAGEDYSIGGDATRAMKKLQEAFGQLVTVDAPGLGNKTYTTTTTLEETRETAKNGGKPAAKQMLLDLEYSEDQANEIMKLAGV